MRETPFPYLGATMILEMLIALIALIAVGVAFNFIGELVTSE